MLTKFLTAKNVFGPGKSRNFSKLTKLPNGLRVYTEQSSPLHRTCTLGLMVGRGSRHETEETNGVAHFLEHLTFKGTKSRSKAQIESEAEDNAIQLNAYTTREQTAFFAHCLTEDIGKASDLVSDIVMNSKLQVSDLEAERPVILRELEEVEANMMEFILDHLHSIAFQRSPLSRTILGPKENISKISQKQIQDYINENYRADKMVFTAVGGNVDHDAIVEMAKKNYSHLKPSDAEGVDYEKSFYIGSEVKMRDDHMKLAHVAYAYEGVAWGDVRSIPLLIATVLIGSYDQASFSAAGSNITSHLARKVAEKDLGPSFQAFNTQYMDTGLFGVYFTSTRMKIYDMHRAIVREISRLCTSISPLELERGKELLKTQYLMSLEGTQPLFDECCRQILYHGRRVPYEEFVAMVDKISIEEFKAVLTDIYDERDHCLAAIGPLEMLGEYQEVRGMSRSFFT